MQNCLINSFFEQKINCKSNYIMYELNVVIPFDISAVGLFSNGMDNNKWLKKNNKNVLCLYLTCDAVR